MWGRGHNLCNYLFTPTPNSDIGPISIKHIHLTYFDGIARKQLGDNTNPKLITGVPNRSNCDRDKQKAVVLNFQIYEFGSTQKVQKDVLFTIWVQSIFVSTGWWKTSIGISEEYLQIGNDTIFQLKALQSQQGSTKTNLCTTI